MSHQYDYSHLVMVTNPFDSGEDLLFFTVRATQTDIHKFLKVKQISFTDIYNIERKDIPVYCFDPYFCNEKRENTILETAASYNSAIHGPIED